MLGATGVEDKLQDDVGQTIAALSEAGIGVWVLTGTLRDGKPADMFLTITVRRQKGDGTEHLLFVWAFYPRYDRVRPLWADCHARWWQAADLH